MESLAIRLTWEQLLKENISFPANPYLADNHNGLGSEKVGLPMLKSRKVPVALIWKYLDYYVDYFCKLVYTELATVLRIYTRGKWIKSQA